MDKIATKSALEQLATVINDKFSNYAPAILVNDFTPDSNGYTKATLGTAFGVTEDDIDTIMSGKCILYDNSGNMYHCTAINVDPSYTVVNYNAFLFDFDYTKLRVTSFMIVESSGTYIMTKATAEVQMTAVQI